jgi:REP element-mobilizing transposase RayT
MPRGGKRPGAGRPKSVRRGGPHRRRPEVSPDHPLHVTLRLNGHPELRQGKARGALRVVLGFMLDAADYRIVHVSIQNNHIHLIVEAANKRALQRGMQRFTIRAARALQVAFGWGRGVKVFPWRYHARPITTPRQARNTLAYVLNNWRRHREDVTNGPRAMKAGIDPYASGLSFDGWIGAPRFKIPDDFVPLPTSPPQTWLLQRGWRRHGLIDRYERPGPLR